MLKVGDKIIEYLIGYMQSRTPLRIVQIARVSKCWAYEASYEKSFSGRGRWKITMPPATPEELAKAEPIIKARLEKEAKAKAAREAEEDRRKKDPRTPFLNRLNSDFEDWNNLTVDQLEIVCDWLDRKPDLFTLKIKTLSLRFMNDQGAQIAKILRAAAEEIEGMSPAWRVKLFDSEGLEVGVADLGDFKDWTYDPDFVEARPK